MNGSLELRLAGLRWSGLTLAHLGVGVGVGGGSGGGSGGGTERGGEGRGAPPLFKGKFDKIDLSRS